MADCNLNSLASQLEVVMETQPDFPQKLKQRLVQELNQMENHFQFIGGLISKGVLCDGSTDSEASYGMKEIMAQIAIMIACTKGVNQIGGLMESLEESGNLKLVSALRTWVKEDFGVEADGDMRQRKDDISTVYSPAPEKLAQQVKSTAEVSSSGIKLIDKVLAKMDTELLEQLEGHLIGKASNIVNARELFSSLARQNLLDESDVELKSGPELETGQWTGKAIKAACSKKAVESLILALQLSGNERVLEETLEWLETSQAKEKNYPIAVKSLANLKNKERPKVVMNTFFEQAALPHGISKLATFKCLQKSATKGISAVQFDKKRMIAHATDSSLNLWNWREFKQESIGVAVNVKNVTCLQYDEDILVLGTADGTVHLFEATTLEEKSSVKLHNQPVMSLKVVQNIVGVITGGVSQVWWMDISRPDMRLINHRCVKSLGSGENYYLYVHMFPDVSFVCSHSYADVYETKSGEMMKDDKKLPSYLVANAADMRTLNMGDLISRKRVAVAGCQNGVIGIWNTSKFCSEQKPVKTFRGQHEPILSLCFLNGHLVGLDQSGKLLMWSGHDLGKNKSIPVPRILLDKSTSTCLAAHERWFATCSSEDDIINIWTVPDAWLCTGGSVYA